MACKEGILTFNGRMKTDSYYNDRKCRELIEQYSLMLLELSQRIDNGEERVIELENKVLIHDKEIKDLKNRTTALEFDNKILMENKERFEKIEKYIHSISEGLFPINKVKFVAMTSEGEGTFFSSIETLAAFFDKKVPVIHQYLASGKRLELDGKEFTLVRICKSSGKK